MTSLLQLLRTRYVSTLRAVDDRWKILVLDERTAAMLDSVIKTYDVLEEGVQQVDLITSARAQQTRLEAIYILTPTRQNVELVLSDFAPPPPAKRKKGDPTPSPEGPKYKAVHVHFVDGIPDALATKLTSGLPHHYLKALTELYVNFHPLEPRAFSLQSPKAFFNLYAPPDHSPKESVQVWEDEVRSMARSIVNTLATLGEYPLIRYYNPPSSFHAPLGAAVTKGQHIGRCLAEKVQEGIDEYARSNSEFPPVPDPPRPRGVLLITDRSMDLCAPLLHEFTYQAMCNDLLEVVDGIKYQYSFRNAQGAMEDKEVLLSEEDSVWKEVRHMHMKDALDKLILDFKNYAGEHGDKFGNEGQTSLNDMKDMLASLPELREVKDKLSLHLTMAEKCMSLFETKKLPLSASVEQCCATGLTPEGKTPKTLVEEMVPLLDDRGVSSTDKLRIIALYIMHRDGVPEGDKKRLYQHARLALHEMDAVNNLSYLGVNVSKDSGKKRKALFKHRSQDDAYDISRYQPAIKYMLEEHFTNKLDQSIFPYVRDAPVDVAASVKSPVASTPGSLRSAKPVWTTRGSERKIINEPKQRIIVFIAGGLCYSEIRAAYKVSESANKDIFIGSTSVITPAQFVADLANLDRGASSSAPYNPATHYEPAPKVKNSKAPPVAVVAPPMPRQTSDASFDRRLANANASAGPPPSSSASSFRARLSRDPPREQQREPSREQQQHREPSRSQYQDPPPSQQQYQERDRFREPPSSQSQQYRSTNNGPAYDSRASYQPPSSSNDYYDPPRSQDRYSQPAAAPTRNDYPSQQDRYPEPSREQQQRYGEVPRPYGNGNGVGAPPPSESSSAAGSMSKKKGFLSRFSK